MSDISHLNRRRMEAELLGRLYAQLLEVLDPDVALQVVSRTMAAAAAQEGRRFATEATAGPSLSHFKSIRDYWGDALEADVVEDGDGAFRFNVVRCKYVEAYKELGLPPELVRTLSCTRDAPFARGYSEQLEFTRAGTIADGAAACDFCYRWTE